MLTEEEEEQVRFVEQVLDEDLEQYKRFLPDREYQAIRNLLRSELLYSSAGKRHLRAAMAASKRTRSDSGDG